MQWVFFFIPTTSRHSIFYHLECYTFIFPVSDENGKGMYSRKAILKISKSSDDYSNVNYNSERKFFFFLN